MTVAQLRALLLRLPQECQGYPVGFSTDDGVWEVVSLLLCGPDDKDVGYPDGVVILTHHISKPEVGSGIRLYKPGPV